MITYLSFEQVVRIHHRMMHEIEGEQQRCLHPGIYENLLSGCLEKPQIIIGGYEPYPDIFSKAAALLECIISSNVFIDGSKRTGFLACELFLELNGYRISPRAAIVEFLLRVAVGTLSVNEISNWLKEHSAKAK
jgi:death-on-curing protein